MLAIAISQKLALVLAIFMLVTDGSEKIVKVFYMYYLVQFQEKQIRVLINNGSKVNAMSPNFI